MDINEIKTEIKKNLGEILNIDQTKILDTDDIISDLNISSFEVAELFLNLETVFNIKMEQNFMLNSTVTVNDISEIIKNKIR